MTTESTTEARLRDIEARCAAATKGKWQAGVPAIDPGYVFTLDPGDGRSIAKIGEDIEEADTELIAHAGGDGGDQAWLVALVRRYRAALVAIRGDGGAPVTHIPAPDVRATYDEGMWVCARCMARYVPGQGGDTDHDAFCPWRIAREALNEEVPP